MLEGFMTWQALVAFVLGVLLSAMVKSAAAAVRGRAAGAVGG
jgi:hypothetical protein